MGDRVWQRTTQHHSTLDQNEQTRPRERSLIKHNAKTREINMQVTVQNPGTKPGLLVIFDETTMKGTGQTAAFIGKTDRNARFRSCTGIVRFQRIVAAIIEEQEATNEELKSAKRRNRIDNEELQSTTKSSRRGRKNYNRPTKN